MIDVPPDDYWETTTCVKCESCGHTFNRWADGPAACPHCCPGACPHCCPGQPKPVGQLASDSTSHMGPAWVWLPSIGRRGRWVPMRGYALISMSSFDRLYEVVEGEPEVASAQSLIDCAATLIARLRGLPTPNPSTSQPRYCDLADRLTQAEAELRAKRAQCDELRDRVVELERTRRP